MGSARGRVGVPPLTAHRQEYAQLIAKGVSNSEACRLVGVHRRTGTRWLYGRTVSFKSGAELHYPPMAISVARSPAFKVTVNSFGRGTPSTPSGRVSTRTAEHTYPSD